MKMVGLNHQKYFSKKIAYSQTRKGNKKINYGSSVSTLL